MTDKRKRAKNKLRAGGADAGAQTGAALGFRIDGERYRYLVEHADDICYVSDAKGVLTYISPQVLRYGFRPDELISRSIPDLVMPEDREYIEESIERTVVTGEEFPTIFRVQDSQGNVHWLEDRGKAVRDKSGRIIGINGFLRDITERKKAEDELQQTRNELETRVRERTLQLSEANKQLSEALEEQKRTGEKVIQHERLSALGQMASGIAHDFNNNLTPIVGYTDFLLGHLETLDDKKETAEMLMTIREAAMQAREAVRRLQKFYRPADGSAHKTVDVNKLILDVIALTRPKWKDEVEEKGFSVKIEAKVEESLFVRGNHRELEEMLTNLIFNAVDAMPNGGTIAFRAQSHASMGRAEIQVADTGTGMTEDVRRRCMEPFFTTKGLHGSGLGLSMAHGIARRHGGSIEIQSAPGKGTTVTVQLIGPTVDFKPEESVCTPPEYVARPLRVLFIDDEITARNLIARYLTAAEHTADTAASGSEGLKKFGATKFDLVITDRAMPGMSGDEVARMIKRASPETPVIMLTGFGAMMDGVLSSPSCVDMVVSKPVTEKDFNEAIRKVMARR